MQTYSLPSGVKPPRPLSNSSFRASAPRCCVSPLSRRSRCRVWRRRSPRRPRRPRPAVRGGPAARPASRGRRPGRTRAAACSRMWSSGDICAALRTKTPPGLSMQACGRRWRGPGPAMLLQVLEVAGRMLVEDDEIDLQPFSAPVGVGGQQLADERRGRRFADAHQHDGLVAGDAVPPQPGCPWRWPSARPAPARRAGPA